MTEKVTPSRVVGRRVERVRDAMTTMKDKIMGNTGSATPAVGDATSGMADRMSSAASTVSGEGRVAADQVSSRAVEARYTVQDQPRS